MHIAYRRDIDGLRAIAVLSVVLFHAFPSVLPGGFVGVDIFFVISGFLITKGIATDVDLGRFSLWEFYRKRARRILPALVVVLAACVVYGVIALRPWALWKLGEHIAAAALFSSNLLLWSESGYFDTSSAGKPLLHLWSLGIEEQFYIVWPLVLLLIGQRRWLRPGVLIVLLAASFAWSVYLVSTNPTAAFYSPFSRAWELGIGAIVAMLRPMGYTRRQWVAELEVICGLAVIGLGLYWLNEKSPFPGAAALPPVIGTALCVYAGGRSFLGRFVLGNPAFVAVGLISYPLYLWHWPLIAFANISTGNQISASLILALVASSFALAAATYFLLERPIRLIPKWNKLSPRLAAVCLIAVGSTGFALHADGGVPSRYPSDVQEVLAIDMLDPRPAGRHPDCWVWAETPVSEFGKQCHFASGSTEPKVMIWGDSHAAMLYTGAKAYLGDRANLAQFTRNACPPLLGFPGYCGEANKQVLEIAKAEKPDVLILFGAWANYRDISYGYDQEADFKATIAQIEKAGIRVVVVGPAPFWEPFLPEIVFKDWMSGTPRELPDRLSQGRPPVIGYWEGLLSSASAEMRVDYLSLLGMYCDPSGCLTHVAGDRGKLIAWDSGHLTTDAAVEVMQAIDRRFKLFAPEPATSSIPSVDQGG